MYSSGNIIKKIHLWKNTEIDHDILTKLAGSNKYEQPNDKPPLPKDFDLFLMQLHKKKDFDATKDALKYATNNQILTLFKAHVSTYIPNRESWKQFEEAGLTSEYTRFVDNPCNIDYIIEKSRLVYSSDSAASFNAIIKGKPVCTYHDNDMSELIPKINTATEIRNIKTLDYNDIKNFFSWYYLIHTLNIRNKDFYRKAESIAVKFKRGMTTKEIFKEPL